MATAEVAKPLDTLIVQEKEILNGVSSASQSDSGLDLPAVPTPEMYKQLLEKLDVTTARLEALEKKLEKSLAKEDDSSKASETEKATEKDSTEKDGESDKEAKDGDDEDDEAKTKTKKDKETETDKDKENETKDDKKKEEEAEKEKEDEEEPPFSIEKMVNYIPAERWGDKWESPEWKSRDPASSTTTTTDPPSDSDASPPPPPPANDKNKAPENKDHYIAVSMFRADSATVLPVRGSSKTPVSGDGLKMEGRKPDRLAIIYTPLLTEIGKICNASVDDARNVFVRPFKHLLDHCEDFENSIEDNEKIRDELLEKKKEILERYEKSIEDAKEEGVEPPRPTLPKNLSEEQRTELKAATRLAYGMRCVLHFLQNDIKDIMEVRKQWKERTLKEIEFEYLWHIFKPGDFVVWTSPENKQQVYRVLHVGGGRPHRVKTDDHDFFLDCFNIEFDGNHYGPSPKKFVISPYEDKRLITNLDVVPLASLPEEEEHALRETLVTRGKKFTRLARVAHQRYNGLSLREGDFRPEDVNGDVIIDFALAFKSNMAGNSINPPDLGGGVIETPTEADVEETYEASQRCNSFGHCEFRCTVDDSKFDLGQRSTFLADNMSEMKKESGKLGAERQLLLPYRVYGYVLLSRKWYPLDIDLVEPLKEKLKDSPDGFEDLVLPEGHKRVVRALVKTHARGARPTTEDKNTKIAPRDIDLVKGKGRGLIILLHGVPGVGKTSTAECVAANTNRPLFPITCGDIGGTSAREVETNLETYFDLARKWGCVLLLDEADVFLGERTKGDIVQNSLVSVFLRVLEYYSGILILTTNRVGQFDEAIKSRIHISLYYPPLGRSDSLKIWKMNLKRLERERKPSSDQNEGSGSNKQRRALQVKFNKEDILAFAKGHWKTCKSNGIHWNGRQIKNAFQTAIALAEWDYLEYQHRDPAKEDAIWLKSDHFKDVAHASARFDQYLAVVRRTDTENAKTQNIRDDNFADTGDKTEFGIRYPTRSEARAKKQAKQRVVDSSAEETEDEDTSDSTDSDSEPRAEAKQKEKGKKDKAQRVKEEAKNRKKEAKKEAKKQAKAKQSDDSDDSDDDSD